VGADRGANREVGATVTAAVIGLPAGATAEWFTKMTRTKEILLRSQQAYASLSSYVGTTLVEISGVFPSTTISGTATAKVTYLRPGKIRIEGKTTPIHPENPDSGAPFTIISDGKKVWKSWSVENSGQYRETTSLVEAIQSMAGVTQNAAKTIPMLLFQLQGLHHDQSSPKKQFLEVFADRAVVDGDERVKGKDCYRVVSSQPFGTWTFWIDSDHFLLRRLESKESNTQISSFTASKGSRAQSVVRKEIFTIEKVNIQLDDRLFQDPTR
jgi:hypothetical protein